MKKSVSVVLVIAILFLCAGAYCGYRFVKHERAQNQRISDLQSSVALINGKLEDNSESQQFKAAVGEGFDYLAIGNSITLHGLTDFWWGQWGMAASEESLDYYHIVKNEIEKENSLVNSMAYNFSAWEVQSHDRGETIDLLDRYLDENLDLITVQLSENVSNLTTFDVDLIELLNHLKTVCPKAKIIVIDDFWSDEKSAIKKNVCETTGVDFVSLSEIRNQASYQAGMGTTVTGQDGETHVIEHNGVATHPGDLGMQYIAEKVLDCIS